MEALVKRALRSRLEAYIVDYSSDRMVNWEIRDVQLKPDAVAALLNLPPQLAIANAASSAIKVIVPWKRLKTDPVVFDLGHVRIDLREAAVPILPSSSTGEDVRDDDKTKKKKKKKKKEREKDKSKGKGKRGFINKVIDGISFRLATGLITLATSGAPNMFALSLEDVVLASTNPDFEVVDLRESRKVNKNSSVVLLYKALNAAAVTLDLVPTCVPKAELAPPIVRLLDNIPLAIHFTGKFADARDNLPVKAHLAFLIDSRRVVVAVNQSHLLDIAHTVVGIQDALAAAPTLPPAKTPESERAPAQAPPAIPPRSRPPRSLPPPPASAFSTSPEVEEAGKGKGKGKGWGSRLRRIVNRKKAHGPASLTEPASDSTSAPAFDPLTQEALAQLTAPSEPREIDDVSSIASDSSGSSMASLASMTSQSAAATPSAAELSLTGDADLEIEFTPAEDIQHNLISLQVDSLVVQLLEPESPAAAFFEAVFVNPTISFIPNLPLPSELLSRLALDPESVAAAADGMQNLKFTQSELQVSMQSLVCRELNAPPTKHPSYTTALSPTSQVASSASAAELAAQHPGTRGGPPLLKLKYVIRHIPRHLKLDTRAESDVVFGRELTGRILAFDAVYDRELLRRVASTVTPASQVLSALVPAERLAQRVDSLVESVLYDDMLCTFELRSPSIALPPYNGYVGPMVLSAQAWRLSADNIVLATVAPSVPPPSVFGSNPLFVAPAGVFPVADTDITSTFALAHALDTLPPQHVQRFQLQCKNVALAVTDVRHPSAVEPWLALPPLNVVVDLAFHEWFVGDDESRTDLPQLELWLSLSDVALSLTQHHYAYLQSVMEQRILFHTRVESSAFAGRLRYLWRTFAEAPPQSDSTTHTLLLDTLDLDEDIFTDIPMVSLLSTHCESAAISLLHDEPGMPPVTLAVFSAAGCQVVAETHIAMLVLKAQVETFDVHSPKHSASPFASLVTPMASAAPVFGLPAHVSTSSGRQQANLVVRLEHLRVNMPPALQLGPESFCTQFSDIMAIPPASPLGAQAFDWLSPAYSKIAFDAAWVRLDGVRVCLLLPAMADIVAFANGSLSGSSASAAAQEQAASVVDALADLILARDARLDVRQFVSGANYDVRLTSCELLVVETPETVECVPVVVEQVDVSRRGLDLNRELVSTAWRGAAISAFVYEHGVLHRSPLAAPTDAAVASLRWLDPALEAWVSQWSVVMPEVQLSLSREQLRVSNRRTFGDVARAARPLPPLPQQASSTSPPRHVGNTRSVHLTLGALALTLADPAAGLHAPPLTTFLVENLRLALADSVSSVDGSLKPGWDYQMVASELVVRDGTGTTVLMPKDLAQGFAASRMPAGRESDRQTPRSASWRTPTMSHAPSPPLADSAAGTTPRVGLANGWFDADELDSPGQIGVSFLASPSPGTQSRPSILPSTASGKLVLDLSAVIGQPSPLPLDSDDGLTSMTDSAVRSSVSAATSTTVSSSSSSSSSSSDLDSVSYSDSGAATELDLESSSSSSELPCTPLPRSHACSSAASGSVARALERPAPGSHETDHGVALLATVVSVYETSSRASQAEATDSITFSSQGVYEWSTTAERHVARRRWNMDVAPLIGLYAPQVVDGITTFFSALGAQQAVRRRYLRMQRSMTAMLGRGTVLDLPTAQRTLQEAQVQAAAAAAVSEQMVAVVAGPSSAGASSDSLPASRVRLDSEPSAEPSPWAEFRRNKILLKAVVRDPSLVLQETSVGSQTSVLELATQTMFVSNENNACAYDLSVNQTDAFVGAALVRLVTADPATLRVSQNVLVIQPFSTRVSSSYKAQGLLGTPFMAITAEAEPIVAEISVRKSLVCWRIVDRYATELGEARTRPVAASTAMADTSRDRDELFVPKEIKVGIKALDVSVVSDYADQVVLFYVYADEASGMASIPQEGDAEFEAVGQLEVMVNNVNFTIPETVIHPFVMGINGRVLPWTVNSKRSRFEAELVALTAVEVTLTKEILRQMTEYVALFSREEAAMSNDMLSHLEYVLINETETAVTFGQTRSKQTVRVGPSSSTVFAFANPYLPKALDLEWETGWQTAHPLALASAGSSTVILHKGINTASAARLGFADPLVSSFSPLSSVAASSSSLSLTSSAAQLATWQEVPLTRGVIASVEARGLKKIVRLTCAHALVNDTPFRVTIRCVGGPEAGRARHVEAGASVAMCHDENWTQASWQVQLHGADAWSAPFAFGRPGSVTPLRLPREAGPSGSQQDLSVLVVFGFGSGGSQQTASLVPPLVIANRSPFPLEFTVGTELIGSDELPPYETRPMFVEATGSLAFRLLPGYDVWSDGVALEVPRALLVGVRSSTRDVTAQPELELSVRVNQRYARGCGARSVFVLVPYVLVNHTEVSLDVKQHGSDAVLALEPGSKIPFSWRGEPAEKSLLVREAGVPEWHAVGALTSESTRILNLSTQCSVVEEVRVLDGSARAVAWKPRLRIINNLDRVVRLDTVPLAEARGSRVTVGAGETRDVAKWTMRVMVGLGEPGDRLHALDHCLQRPIEVLDSGDVWGSVRIGLDEAESKASTVRLASLGGNGRFEYHTFEVVVTNIGFVSHVALNPAREAAEQVIINRSKETLVVRRHAHTLPLGPRSPTAGLSQEPEELVVLVPGEMKPLHWPSSVSHRRIQVARLGEGRVTSVPWDPVSEFRIADPPTGRLGVVDGQIVRLLLPLDWSHPFAVQALGDGEVNLEGSGEWTSLASEARGYGSIPGTSSSNAARGVVTRTRSRRSVRMSLNASDLAALHGVGVDALDVDALLFGGEGEASGEASDGDDSEPEGEAGANTGGLQRLRYVVRMRGVTKAVVLEGSGGGGSRGGGGGGDDDDPGSARLRIRVPAAGVTLADEASGGELVHMSLEEVRCEVHMTGGKEHAHLTVGNVQVDNMMPLAEYDVVLALADSHAGIGSQDASMVEALFEWSIDDGFRSIEYCGLRLLPLVAKIDGGLVSKLVEMRAFFGGEDKARKTLGAKDPSVRRARYVVDENPLPVGLQRSETDEMYIDALVIFPISIMVCVGDNDMDWPIIRDGAPLELAHCQQMQWFVSRAELVPALRKMYFDNTLGLADMGVFVGSLDVIGNPLGALARIREGCTDFVRLPFNALVMDDTPGAFFFGLARGTYSLVKNVSDAALMSLYKITSTVARSAARLTFDDRYIAVKRRAARRHPRNVVVGFGLGSLEFGRGLWSGCSGLVLQPWYGAQRRGWLLGGMLGTGKGLVGLPLKSIDGTFDLLSKVFEGLKNSTGTGQYVVQKRVHVSPARTEALLKAGLSGWCVDHGCEYVTHFVAKMEAGPHAGERRMIDHVLVVSMDGILVFALADVLHDCVLAASARKSMRSWGHRARAALMQAPEPEVLATRADATGQMPARRAAEVSLNMLRGLVTSAQPLNIGFGDVSEIVVPDAPAARFVIALRRMIGGRDRLVCVVGDREDKLAEIGAVYRASTGEFLQVVRPRDSAQR
ncbi:uncharacterized protein AMSG_04005 [Thecamonas trahens ATCC 50062]|uniref:Chorein N-terminal domain-containing protein n=1 Tax=Thecamonas trahens ATCC 50062 TaxID=461836 RepID=A0A0L0D909_THETB|nr:hypothetical protein AMSG_04005 [Thecamonas trahens ATCC 50062]KNC47778.1 hypothetical protein AMSG_04005 [Thecamonas trahens ATCC 50062]|eukprot:XP_013759256.1 hypothetical protein AMSG_04005 [Thecamonas trahens ATCC 50062]